MDERSDTKVHDVVVLGLGAFGAATLRALAVRGLDVVGIDRFAPPHDSGSSHGASRITRIAVGEDDVLVPLVRRSHEIWRELEGDGASLLVENGALLIGNAGGTGIHHGRIDFVRRSIEIAEQHGIAHDVLDAAMVMERFPQFTLRGDELAYFEPGGGLVRPEACIDAQLAAAVRAGAVLRVDEAVRHIDARADHVVVTTDRGVVVARQVVSCLGAWTSRLLGAPWETTLRVHRQTLYWFDADDAPAYAPARFPVFIWMHGARAADYFYGFPELDGRDGVKVATEQYDVTSDPDAHDGDTTPEEMRAMIDAHVDGRLRGLSDRCRKTSRCFYTATADSRFRIDRHPSMPAVIVVSACSGHGFKHSAGAGEQVAAWCATERRPDVLAPFALDAA